MSYLRGNVFDFSIAFEKFICSVEYVNHALTFILKN